MRYALSVIDRVHTDGVLTRLPATADGSLDSNGVFNIDENGAPVSIVVNPHGPHPELTCVHEIGHLLDRQALDSPGAFASQGSPSLESWRNAVVQSEAVRTLVERTRTVLVTVTLATGVTANVFVDPAVAEYYLLPRELFARSYAQFVASSSRDALLNKQLADAVSAVEWQVYPAQWEEADFAPIMAALRDLFQGKGWLR